MEITARASLLKVAERIEKLTRELPALLLLIPAEEFESRPAPGKWSKKEVLGHLVDSASNNHHRFVRIQYQHVPHIAYHQDEWVRLQNYQDEPREDVVTLWAAFNKHLAHVIKNISTANYLLKGDTGKDAPSEVTLEWLVEDYLKHMEYHLKQVIPSYFP